ncbi:sensor domain-containing diguanylate cyclase [Rheinheimera sp.]|uniref:sensor domain-containing diguanylate cyclase n=1 Tax=Rheinheimera sp. TaxID=1869214 RepID=UPI0027375A64|nr:sensor domain-containing diguanylate cyclase [Rheinheimera sp.]MDP2715694.1 sensor domain-containing diguanylate cyclase [Rheinheimera sp.]
MSDNAVALPHFWAIIDALPIAVLYKEHARSRILANRAALQLFNPPLTEHALTLSDVQQLRLLSRDTQTPYDLLHNPLLLALSGTELTQPLLLAGEPAQNMLLRSRLISLSFTLHTSVLITLETDNSNSPAVLPDNNYPAPDISELEEALAFDKLISLISTELINVQDDELDQHIEDALAAVGEFCHADRSYVFQFNAKITEMSNTHEWVRSGISSHKASLQQIPRQALPYFYREIQQNLVFAVNNVAELPTEAAAEQQEFNAEDIQSVLCCAMLAGDALIGFVGCDMVSRQRNWTSNDLRRLKLVGEMLANTLQNVSYRRSLQQIQLQLQQANAELQQQALQDGLTGIANRRNFDTKLQQELQRCARHQISLGLLLLDIDHFKAYNDHYGHQAGDQALQQVAQLLPGLLKRQGELAARYGGEEFAVILPGSDEAACQQIAEKIQQQLNALAIRHQHSGVSKLLTLSIGYCSQIPDKNSSAEQLIQAADSALYKAKDSGRNQLMPCEKKGS